MQEVTTGMTKEKKQNEVNRKGNVERKVKLEYRHRNVRKH